MATDNTLVTARREAFLPAVAARLAREDWLKTAVFVPTARSAARLRTALAAVRPGILPRIMTLRDSAEMAELLGFDVPKAADGWAVRGQIYRHLEATETAEKRALAAKEMADLMNRLALHGVVDVCGEGVFPGILRGYFEVQAGILLGVMSDVRAWLAARGEVLAGDAERVALEQAALRLDDPACGVLPVWAGIWDSVPAGAVLARAVAKRGLVMEPDAGGYTAALVGELVGDMDFAGHGTGSVTEVVAGDEWQEVRLAALAVKRALAQGDGRIAVVCPARSALDKVGTELERWGIAAELGAGLRASDSPNGRAFAATAALVLRGTPRTAAQWRELVALDGPLDTVAEWLMPLDSMEGLWEGADYAAMACVALEETCLPRAAVTRGVWLLGALEARLLDFDTVIMMQAVEGVWPAPSFDPWLSEGHLRTLGLPDAVRRAQLAGAEFESMVNGGSRRVVVTRSRLTDGREAVPSRFLTGVARVADTELAGLPAVMEQRHLPDAAGLGTFVPEGEMWPHYWSASMVETLLACPYRALGERVLKLLPPEPLLPVPDARDGGILAHRWLEMVGRERLKDMTEARMLALGDTALRGFDRVVQAIWRPKLARLAPVILAQWQASGRLPDSVERRMEADVGDVTVRATFDRVERGAGGAVVVDYKTSSPPPWPLVADGRKPQLAIEAWLLQRNGVSDVADMEFWHLRGYGTAPLKVAAVTHTRGHDVASMVAPVGAGLARLAETFGEGQPWPAVPDRSGGGLVASGHCEHCALAGVCRRQDAAAGFQDVSVSGSQDFEGWK